MASLEKNIKKRFKNFAEYFLIIKEKTENLFSKNFWWYNCQNQTEKVLMIFQDFIELWRKFKEFLLHRIRDKKNTEI